MLSVRLDARMSCFRSCVVSSHPEGDRRGTAPGQGRILTRAFTTCRPQVSAQAWPAQQDRGSKASGLTRSFLPALSRGGVRSWLLLAWARLPCGSPADHQHRVLGAQDRRQSRKKLAEGSGLARDRLARLHDLAMPAWHRCERSHARRSRGVDSEFAWRGGSQAITHEMEAVMSTASVVRWMTRSRDTRC